MLQVCFQKATRKGKNKRTIDSADLQPIQYALISASPFKNTPPVILNDEVRYSIIKFLILNRTKDFKAFIEKHPATEGKL